MKKKINGYIAIMRPVNCVMAAITMPSIVFILGSALPESRLFASALVAFMLCAAGNTLNDYFDIKVDRVNKPSRPIPSGALGKDEALAFAAILFFASLYVAATISAMIFGVVLFASILLAVYDARSKKMGFAGNIVVSFLVALVIVSAGLLAGNVTLSLYVAVPAFLINLSRELVKTAEDVKGDSKISKNTFPLKYGVKRTAEIASLLALLGSLALINLYRFFGVPYLVLLFPAIYKFFSVVANRKKMTPAVAAKVSKNIKIGSAIVIAALVVANLLK